jgi:hypothetical protein
MVKDQMSKHKPKRLKSKTRVRIKTMMNNKEHRNSSQKRRVTMVRLKRTQKQKKIVMIHNQHNMLNPPIRLIRHQNNN